MRLKELLLSEDDVAEEAANILNTEIDGWLGNGEWGHAYATTNDTVIKVTRLKHEAVYARKLKDHPSKHLVKVYNVFKLGTYYVIHQEMLDVGSHIEDIYYAVENALENNNLSWDDDLSDVDEVDPEVKKFMSDISDGIYQLERMGIQSLDLQPDNIGARNGDYVLFDITDKSAL